ncbi:MAG: hypothetical protein F4X92_05215 [Gammaproteobacteria bacterium]|nr:hypothetical protein [Gammaproteobacteria bacterium]
MVRHPLPYVAMSAVERKTMARVALREIDSPVCPFQVGTPTCSKRGGVCSIREGDNLPVIVCPRRFNAGNLLPRWLAEIAEFPEVHLASEAPFMRSPTTGRGRVASIWSLPETGPPAPGTGLKYRLYISPGREWMLIFGRS